MLSDMLVTPEQPSEGQIWTRSRAGHQRIPVCGTQAPARPGHQTRPPLARPRPVRPFAPPALLTVTRNPALTQKECPCPAGWAPRRQSSCVRALDPHYWWLSTLSHRTLFQVDRKVPLYTLIQFWESHFYLVVLPLQHFRVHQADSHLPVCSMEDPQLSWTLTMGSSKQLHLSKCINYSCYFQRWIKLLKLNLDLYTLSKDEPK